MKKIEGQEKAFEVTDFLMRIAEERKVSNYRISKMTGISEGALSMIKNHKQSPTLALVIIIADALEISLKDVFERLN